MAGTAFWALSLVLVPKTPNIARAKWRHSWTDRGLGLLEKVRKKRLVGINSAISVDRSFRSIGLIRIGTLQEGSIRLFL